MINLGGKKRSQLAVTTIWWIINFLIRPLIPILNAVETFLSTNYNTILTLLNKMFTYTGLNINMQLKKYLFQNDVHINSSYNECIHYKHEKFIANSKHFL